MTETGMNRVDARGRIVAVGNLFTRRGEAYREIRLLIRGQYQARAIYLNFVIKDSNIDDDFKVGDYVDIEGHINSYFRRSSTWNAERSRTYVQEFIIDKMAHAVTILEDVFGVKGGFAQQRNYFRAAYKGEVTRVERDTHDRKTGEPLRDRRNNKVEYVRVFVRVPNPTSPNGTGIVLAQYSSNMRVNDIKPKVGDKIIVSTNITTVSKYINNSRAEFQNLQIDDMLVVEEAPERDATEESPIESTEQIQSVENQNDDSKDVNVDTSTSETTSENIKVVKMTSTADSNVQEDEEEALETSTEEDEMFN